MALAFDLLDVDGTFIRTLTGLVKAEQGWSQPRGSHGTGRGTLVIPNDHAHYADVTYDRLIRCSLDGVDQFVWILQEDDDHRLNMGSDRRAGEVTVWQGDGGLALLGGGRYRSAIVVGDERTGLKVFGWVANEWDDSAWTSPAPHSGGSYKQPRLASRRGKPDRWPYDFSEWLWGSAGSPTGTFWVRQHNTTFTGEAELWITGKARVWLNGEEIAEVGRITDAVRVNVDLTGDDLLAVRGDGEAMWFVARFSEETVNGEPEEVMDVLFGSTTGAVFDASRVEIQEIVVDAEAEPYPWGPDYPSTGPDNLQGEIYLTYDGKKTSGISVIEADGTFDPAAVEAALEALPNIAGVAVTGTGKSADPLRVEWDDSGPRQLLQLDHSELRHDHDTTAVNQVQRGETNQGSIGGANTIKFTAVEPTGVTAGYVMSRLITAAKTRGAIQMVTYTFTDDVDSDGDPWQVSLPIITLSHGQQLGDVATEFTQRFKVELEMLPTLEFGMFDLATFGTDTAIQMTDADPVAANNVVADAVVRGQTPHATAVSIETDGGFGWSPSASGVPVGATVRRETAATFGLDTEVSEVVAAAEQLLEDGKGARTQVLITKGPAGARPLINYKAGDWVRARERAGGGYLTVRVEDITPVELPAGEVQFTVHVERQL